MGASTQLLPYKTIKGIDSRCDCRLATSRLRLRKPKLVRGKATPMRINKIKRQKGVTGLETAIILIAFVIVASVLAYVTVSAGLFSSQKAKVAVNKGLETSNSTLEPKGDVIIEMAEASQALNKLYLTIGLVPGGSPMDLAPNPPPPAAAGDPKLIISYSDASQRVLSLYYTVDYINSNNGDDILDPQELAQVTVYMDADLYDDNTDTIRYMPNDIKAGTSFTLTITPPDSSLLPIERSIPSGAKVAAGAGTLLVNLK
jgi:archaeal flagellin FlaB